MTTRFYFASSASAAPAIAPPFSSQWDSNSGVRRSLTLTPVGANDTIGSGESGVANTNKAMRQYIYPLALAGQTITGTLKGQVLAQEQVATDDCFAQLRAFVVTPALTVRGVLIEVDNSALSHEFDVTGVNRKYPRSSPASVSSVAVQGGDFLVVEIGFRQTSTATNTVNLQIIGNAGADLPEDEIDTSLSNAWVEFSQTLVFGDDPPLGYAKNRVATQAAVVASWYKWRPRGASGGGVAQASPDNPPFSDREPLIDILRSWETEVRPPHLRRARTPQQAVGPQDPPFNSRAQAQQVAVATTWYKWRPAGTSGGGFPPAVDNPPFQRPSVQAANLWWAQPDDIIEIIMPGLILWPDDPPFDQLQVKSIHASIVTVWQPEWTGRQRARNAIQGVVVQADNPPFNERRQPNLLHWEPAQPPVQARVLIPQPSTVSVDNPPFKGRDTLTPVLRTWQPESVIITKSLPPPSSVDNPPRLSKVFDQRAWEIPLPPQQARKLVVQPGVTAPSDDPPRRDFNSLYTILGIWYKSLEQPIVLAQTLPPSFLGSPAVVNFPPPKAMRQPDYGFWWADPQPTQMRTMIPQEFVPPPPNPCFVEEGGVVNTWIPGAIITNTWAKESGSTNIWSRETPKRC